MAINILISVSAGGNGEFYEKAVARAGGDPVCRYAPTSLEGFDGLLLAGGADVAPRFYGQQDCGSEGIDAVRDKAEFALLSEAGERGVPVLGICRGMQVINVWAGGTLFQNIPGHRADDGFTDHDVTACGMLREIYGEKIHVNSSHHQAVDRPGGGFTVTAVCGDVAEAMEHDSLPVIAVQFHPEKMKIGDALFSRWIGKIREGKEKCSDIS